MSLFHRFVLLCALTLVTAGAPMPVSAAPMPEPYPITAPTQVSAIHQDGQTFVTWNEIAQIIPMDAPTGKEFYGIRSTFDRDIRYRIYASDQPIVSLEGMTPIQEVNSLSGWNPDLYGVNTYLADYPMRRYVIPGSPDPLPNGTGLAVITVKTPGYRYYAVTAVVNRIEARILGDSNRTPAPLFESVGTGKPILQKVETPESFQGVSNPTLRYYVRWEGPPNCNSEGKPFNYLVAYPQKTVTPAPVGLHMHCWGGSLFSGYGGWTDAEDGAILLVSNLDPYDWWTGYHERLTSISSPMTAAQWQSGVVRSYTRNRMFSFLYWLSLENPGQIDLHRTFTAGSSMGGSGSMMTAIREGSRVAWVRSNVGVHSPIESPFRTDYARVYGPPELGVLHESGIPVWQYYDDVWFLRQYPEAEVPFLIFCNGKNDSIIGWSQAVHFYQALQDTKRPHVFSWGMDGHGQLAIMPGNGSTTQMPMDIRVNQSLPAFTHCSLDDDPGDGTLESGKLTGQVNGYLLWETTTIVDTPSTWEMTVQLSESAPADECTTDLTPRRLQQFSIQPGGTATYQVLDLKTRAVLKEGTVQADASRLVTLEAIPVTKSGVRVILKR